MDFKEFFSSHFVWGLGLGLLFAVLSAWGHFKTKREYKRYRRHLSDKLELEARQYELIRKEKETLTKENENLRLRIGQLNEKPDQKQSRELEIFARAQKTMMVQAPGFAGAWENAKTAAAEEMAAEDQGRSLPKRIFSRLFGSGTREAISAESATSPSSGTASSSPNGAENSATSPASGSTSANEPATAEKTPG